MAPPVSVGPFCYSGFVHERMLRVALCGAGRRIIPLPAMTAQGELLSGMMIK